MSTNRANNWENHFREHPENEASNQTIDELMQLFNQDATVEACLINAVEEKNTVFMVKTPLSGGITFIHHITKLGGTRSSKEKKIFALVGTAESAYPAQSTKEILFDTFETKTPSWTAISSAEETTPLEDLPARSKKSLRPAIPLPPFLAAALSDLGGASVIDLLDETLRRIGEFDSSQADDSPHPKAAENLKPIVFWL